MENTWAKPSTAVGVLVALIQGKIAKERLSVIPVRNGATLLFTASRPTVVKAGLPKESPKFTDAKRSR